MNPITAGVTAGKRMPPRFSKKKDTKFGTTAERAGAQKGKFLPRGKHMTGGKGY